MRQSLGPRGGRICFSSRPREVGVAVLQVWLEISLEIEG